MSGEDQARLGLRENWRQFTLLVVVNAFVGGMVGMERTIVPLMAEEDFHIVAKTAMLTFIAVFGITKAISNFYAGRWAQRWSRRKVLIAGWVLAFPVPFILIWAPSWGWVIAANALLGIHQGLAWSSTVVMKMDLVGERQRGLAMGFNEAAGYIAVGVAAWATGYIASTHSLRPEPFYLGIAFAIIGLLLSLIWVKDTGKFVHLESRDSTAKKQKRVFLDTSFRDPWLSSASFSGMVNNLNDGLIWGLLPLLLVGLGYNLSQVGWLISVYPVVWGLGQAFTGGLADRFPKNRVIFLGMTLQALAIAGMAIFHGIADLVAMSVLLGVGTALVYPALLAAVAERAHPYQRAESVGVYRMWRDLGYAVGALLAGILYDSFGFQAAFLLISVLTLTAGINSLIRMRKAATQ